MSQYNNSISTGGRKPITIAESKPIHTFRYFFLKTLLMARHVSLIMRLTDVMPTRKQYWRVEALAPEKNIYDTCEDHAYDHDKECQNTLISLKLQDISGHPMYDVCYEGQ